MSDKLGKIVKKKKTDILKTTTLSLRIAFLLGISLVPHENDTDTNIKNPPLLFIEVFLCVRHCYKHFSVCWRRQWQSTPVLLPGKSHGRRNLVGCSPWGH